MKWNQFPALRVLIFYLLFYFLFSYVHWIGSVIGVLALLFLWLLKIIQVKVCFLLIVFQLLIMGRLSIDESVKLPDNHYLVERVLKDNETKTTLIARNALFKYLISIKKKDYNSSFFLKGDVVWCDVKGKSIMNPKDLNGFIYKDYLNELRVDSVIYAMSTPLLVFRDLKSIRFAAARLKRFFISKYKGINEVSQETRGVLIALFFGDKSFLDFDHKTLFKDAGVVHVLAISGLHVGILYVSLAFVFGKLLRFKKWSRFAFVSGILIFYAFLTGLSPSVSRATLMFVLVYFGKSINSKPTSLNIVFTTGLMMLFYEPEVLYDIGFQLSYSAVIGILIVSQYSFLNVRHKNQYIEGIFGLMKVNLAAFIFTAPIIVFYFHTINFTSLWASFIVVPIITVVMYMGVFSMGVFWIPALFLFMIKCLDVLLVFSTIVLKFIVNHILLREVAVVDLTLLFVSLSLVVVLFFWQWRMLIIPCALMLSSFFFQDSKKLRFLNKKDVVQVKFDEKVVDLELNECFVLDGLIRVCKMKNDEVLFHRLTGSVDLNIQGAELFTEENDSVFVNFNIDNYKTLTLEF
jgi:competence protein ComEC